MEWRKLCRICGKENGNEIDIFIKNENFNNIAEIIHKFFSVWINRFDESPTKICSICNEFLIALLKFSDQMSKVQQMFLEIESNLKLESKVNLAELREKYGLEILNLKTSLSEEAQDQFSSSNNLQEETCTIKAKHIKKTKKKSKLEKFTESLCNVFEVKENEDKVAKSEDHCDYKEEDESEDDCCDGGDDEYMPLEDLDLSKQEEIENTAEENEKIDEEWNNKPSLKHKKKRIKKKFDEEEKKYKCKICELRVVRECDLSRHLRKAHSVFPSNVKVRSKKTFKEEEKMFQCEICQMKFFRECNLSRHLREAHKIIKEIPPCEFCGKTFSTIRKLRFHQQTHLSPEEREKFLIPCPLCDQKFSQKGAMRAHIVGTHSTERPFICEMCGKSFSSSSNLSSHRKKKHVETRVACSICQRICKNQSTLRGHMLTHKDPSVPCHICGALLKSKTILKNHMLLHSDVKAFKCNYCGKDFKRDITLQLHMIIHTGLKPFICRFCGQGYANPSNCKKHEKQSHPFDFQAAESASQSRFQNKLPTIQQLETMLQDMKSKEVEGCS